MNLKGPVGSGGGPDCQTQGFVLAAHSGLRGLFLEHFSGRESVQVTDMAQKWRPVFLGANFAVNRAGEVRKGLGPALTGQNRS